MTSFIDIKPGQWALAFDKAFFYPGSDMRQWLEKFTTWGGGWDGFSADDIFVVHQVKNVMPKTYLAKDWRNWGDHPADPYTRYSRENVIQAFDTEAQAIQIRDRFHSIGVKTTKSIEKETARLIKAFADKKEAEALKEIHRCLPHIFGRQA